MPYDSGAYSSVKLSVARTRVAGNLQVDTSTQQTMNNSYKTVWLFEYSKSIIGMKVMASVCDKLGMYRIISLPQVPCLTRHNSTNLTRSDTISLTFTPIWSLVTSFSLKENLAEVSRIHATKTKLDIFLHILTRNCFTRLEWTFGCPVLVISRSACTLWPLTYLSRDFSLGDSPSPNYLGRKILSGSQWRTGWVLVLSLCFRSPNAGFAQGCGAAEAFLNWT